jgi:hypothetical protein
MLEVHLLDPDRSGLFISYSTVQTVSDQLLSEITQSGKSDRGAREDLWICQKAINELHTLKEDNN